MRYVAHENEIVGGERPARPYDIAIYEAVPRAPCGAPVDA
jgi:hypothetical protein